MWCAVRGTDLVGVAAAGPSWDPGSGAGTGEVYAIYLEPQVVGTEVGRRLFAHVMDQLRGGGSHVAVLWVLSTNARARRFYERARWRADGAEKTEDWRGTALHEVRYRIDLAPKTPCYPPSGSWQPSDPNAVLAGQSGRRSSLHRIGICFSSWTSWASARPSRWIDVRRT